MSTEAAKQWILKLKDDEELLKTVASTKTPKEKLALAKEYGFEFTVEEVKQAATSFTEELSDDDLDNVSGGSFAGVLTGALMGAELGPEGIIVGAIVGGQTM